MKKIFRSLLLGSAVILASGIFVSIWASTHSRHVMQLSLVAQASPSPTPSPTPDPSASPSPTPDPSASPSPTPDPSASPDPTPPPPPQPLPDCPYPLVAASPSQFGLANEDDLPVIPVTATVDDTFDYYEIAATLSPGNDSVGIVLPVDSIDSVSSYTVDSQAHGGPNYDYDVSGCWGPSVIRVWAKAGMYDILAGPMASTTPAATTTTAALAKVAVVAVPKGSTCEAQTQAQAAEAVAVPVNTATSFKDTSVNPNVTYVANVANYNQDGFEKMSFLTMQTRLNYVGSGNTFSHVLPFAQYKAMKLLDGATALNDFKQAISDFFTANKATIKINEFGHGGLWPDGMIGWKNPDAYFACDNDGVATPDAAALAAAGKGKVSFLDLMSCSVAYKNTDDTTPNAKHIMTYLAQNMVKDGVAVTVRGFSVTLWQAWPQWKYMKGPSQFPDNEMKRAWSKPGVFFIKNMEEYPVGPGPDAPTVKLPAHRVQTTCSGPGPTCTNQVDPIYPANP